MAVTSDPEHKFELALQLGELKVAYQIAVESESEQKWKQLAELATVKGELSLAQECLHKAHDMGALLLLATSAGNAEMVDRLAHTAQSSGQNNVAFASYFVLGRLEKCLDVLISTNRLPEAAFFARTYLPTQVTRVVKLWREQLAKTNRKMAESLADPSQYENLFPDLQNAQKSEQFLKQQRRQLKAARSFPSVPMSADRAPIDEMVQAEAAGAFRFSEAIMDDEEGPPSPPPSPVNNQSAVPVSGTASSPSRTTPPFGGRTGPPEVKRTHSPAEVMQASASPSAQQHSRMSKDRRSPIVQDFAAGMKDHMPSGHDWSPGRHSPASHSPGRRSPAVRESSSPGFGRQSPGFGRQSPGFREGFSASAGRKSPLRHGYHGSSEGATAAAVATSSFGIGAASKSLSEKTVAELERELELDLENIQIDDNIDTSDINLDEDLLED